MCFKECWSKAIQVLSSENSLFFISVPFIGIPDFIWHCLNSKDEEMRRYMAVLSGLSLRLKLDGYVGIIYNRCRLFLCNRLNSVYSHVIESKAFQCQLITEYLVFLSVMCGRCRLREWIDPCYCQIRHCLPDQITIRLYHRMCVSCYQTLQQKFTFSKTLGAVNKTLEYRDTPPSSLSFKKREITDNVAL